MIVQNGRTIVCATTSRCILNANILHVWLVGLDDGTEVGKNTGNRVRVGRGTETTAKLLQHGSFTPSSVEQ
eukprot:scaffold2220_cov75-Cylindrotheca_fusiformis.AAC.13